MTADELIAFEADIAREFYVYEHWRPDLEECFYVGKGSGKRSHRYRRGEKYNEICDTLTRCGLKVEVRFVAKNLTEHESFNIERNRIAFWRDRGVDLANVIDGGGGVRGDWQSANMKAIHANPEYKEKHRAAIISALARPEVRMRLRAAACEAQGREEVRAATRSRMIAERAKADREEKRNQNLRQTLAKPEIKELKRKAMLEVRSRLGMEDKIVSGIKAAMKRPEVIAKLGVQTLGSRWINNGLQNRRLRASLALPEGWSYGKVRP